MPVLPDASPSPPSPTTGVQPWASLDDVCAPCNGDDFDTDLLTKCLLFASEVLYNLTGRQWPGEQTDVIRPCGIRTTVPWGRFETGNTFGLPDAGWCGCNRPRSCGCQHLSEIKLPGYPVVGINDVKIDGESVDPARYRIDDHRWLVWLPDPDGLEPRAGWPCCQRIDLPDTELDTFSISYSYGQLPDQGGVMAATSLGCQLALAFGGDPNNKCRLPKRITSITRQSVTIAVLDPFTLFKDGQTGLSEVDLWISSKTVGAKKRRATIYRIGSGRKVRRAGQ